VTERLDHDGNVLTELSEDSLRAAIESVEASGVGSAAVSLLHAYANPAHERLAGDRLRQIVPHVSLSHRINPEAREFERTAATVLNAAVMPITVDYLDELQAKVPLDGGLHIFHSAGGMASPEAVRERPLVMALSGPAAGVAGAARMAEFLGQGRVLSFDMGGTTTDVCLVIDGQAEITDDRLIAGRPLRQPMVDVHSIGAGGGSIVRLGAGGLAVGPDSAGAGPGPACYGQGGTEPTVTDANVALGYLNPRKKLGGSIALDPGLAVAALKPMADELKVSVPELAFGVLRIANATMARALRRVTVERGIDGRRCALLAFGGAGPMHAAGLAREFGIGQVVVPQVSSGFSALGCLLADVSYTQQQTLRMARDDWDAGRFEAIRGELVGAVTAPLLARGYSEKDIVVEHVAMVRYQAQNYAVEVGFEAPLEIAAIDAEFARVHERLYGFAMDEPWRLQGLRVKASLPSALAPQARPGTGRSEPFATDPCWFDAGEAVPTPRYVRDDVAVDAPLSGPAIIEDDWSTIVVPPGWQARRDGHDNLFMQEVGA
jgi:N-methylhydantoinase A